MKSRIIKHKKLSVGANEFPPRQLTSTRMAAIERHVRKYVGPVRSVMHEILSVGIHLDVLPVVATKTRPFQTFVTMGMSALPMRTPTGRGGARFAELLIVLPPTWPTGLDGTTKKATESSYWPIRWLKELARMPSDYDTFLDVGHTVPNGDPPERLAPGCGFIGFMLLPPALFPERFFRLRIGPTTVTFLELIPLYPEEMQLKLDRGVAELFNRFELIEGDFFFTDPKRPNACAGSMKRRRRTS